MSNAPSAARASSTSPASPAGPEDWLGYGLYADSLWARVRLSLNTAQLQSPHALPTADPLVVGVYGEWGAGKSRLLELVYDRARRQNGQDVALRIQDPDAFQASPLLSVTVPVWFHPWRYEHEPHLAVPLLMHISEALQSTLKDMSTWRESADQALVALGKPAAELMEQAQEKWSMVEATAKAVSKVAGHGVTQAVVGLAAGLVGAGGLAKDGLDTIKDTADRIAGDDEKGEEKGKDKGKEKEKPDSKAKPSPPAYTADGRHYYQVQKFLRDLSRITPVEAKAQGVALTHAVELRFVVFIDDLDRCLPEKAVAMLEVIKTVFNVESFAFVVALDDEVIERGISHRYRDYRFKGAKPEMPITGFEYLEKIVHLPFRLPALTREQAETFLRQHEDRLMSDPALPTGCARLWFSRALERALDDDEDMGKGARYMAVRASPLTQMLLDSFEAFVPRKLLRAQELMHQWQCVLANRRSAMWGDDDKAMFLALALLQLFAPDLYRLVRRRPGLWREWMNAHLPMEAGYAPVFSPERRERPPHYDLNASDVSLLRWAAIGPRAGIVKNALVNSSFVLDSKALGGDIPAWRAAVAESLANEPATLHSAEQVRLPFVLALCEYRNAHRHAFNPLLMGAGLVHMLQWQSTTMVSDPAHYWTLLPEDSPPLSWRKQAGFGAAGAGIRVRTDLSFSTLREILSSSDASTRSSLVEQWGLKPGDQIPGAMLAEVALVIKELSITQQLAVWAQLAPYVAVDDLPPDLGERYQGLNVEGSDLPFLAPSLKTLGDHKLLTPLGLARQVDTVRQTLGLRRDDLKQPVKEREQAAITVAALGDDRFDFDPQRWQLPSKRARVLDGQTWRAATPHEEPIPGFVRVEGGRFELGLEGGSNSPPASIELPTFYMARTLTTVAQWQCFVQSGGYDNPRWWQDPQGWDWRQGLFDSKMRPTRHEEWLETRFIDLRPKGQRHEPLDWIEQLSRPYNPVWGVNWFEARAYARWLTGKLQAELGTADLAGWQVSLPTEDHTKRAQRAASLTQADSRRYPWGDDEAQAAQHANCEATGLRHASPVGLFSPNPLGLFDMAGNLRAWQSNLYQGAQPRMRKYGSNEGLTLESHENSNRCDRPVKCGGSFLSSEFRLRCGSWVMSLPDSSNADSGVRLMLSNAP